MSQALQQLPVEGKWGSQELSQWTARELNTLKSAKQSKKISINRPVLHTDYNLCSVDRRENFVQVYHRNWLKYTFKIVDFDLKHTGSRNPTNMKSQKILNKALALYNESSWHSLEGVRWQACALTQFYRNKRAFYRRPLRYEYYPCTKYQAWACSPTRKITEDGEKR